MAIIPNYKEAWDRFPVERVTDIEHGVSTYSSGLRLELPMVPLDKNYHDVEQFSRPQYYLALLPVTTRNIVDQLQQGQSTDIPQCYAILLQDSGSSYGPVSKDLFRVHEHLVFFQNNADIGLRSELGDHFNSIKHGWKDFLTVRTVFMPIKLPPIVNLSPPKHLFLANLLYKLRLPSIFSVEITKRYEIQVDASGESSEIILLPRPSEDGIDISACPFQASVQPRQVIWVEAWDDIHREGFRIFLIMPWRVQERKTRDRKDQEYVPWAALDARTFDRQDVDQDIAHFDIPKTILRGDVRPARSDCQAEPCSPGELTTFISNTDKRSWTLRLPTTQRYIAMEADLKNVEFDGSEGDYAIDVQVSIVE